jgi:hypothetical protein
MINIRKKYYKRPNNEALLNDSGMFLQANCLPTKRQNKKKRTKCFSKYAKQSLIQ